MILAKNMTADNEKQEEKIPLLFQTSKSPTKKSLDKHSIFSLKPVLGKS